MSKAFGLSECPEQSMQLDRGSQVHAVSNDPDETGPRPAQTADVDVLATTEVPGTLKERLVLARARLRHAAINGIRVRVYEVALDLDMSEFHFARQFRAQYGCSPHVFYDEVRAARARELLSEGVPQGQVARRIGLRRPAELRALLARRKGLEGIAETATG